MKTQPNFRRNFMNQLDGKPQMSSTPYDPTKLQYPYLKASDLLKDVPYKLRVLPAHAEKYPKGYIKVTRHKLVMPEGNTSYIVCPSCWGGDDPFGEILEYAQAKIRDNPELGQRLNEDEVARQAIEELCKPWSQFIIPILLYASCKQKKDNNGYNVFYDYQPDPKTTEPLVRLFQINESKATKLLVDQFQPKAPHHDEDYVPFNGLEIGVNLSMTVSTGPTPYNFMPTGFPSALLADVKTKLEDDSNYPNLYEREVLKYRKSETEIINLFHKSVLGQVFKALGLLKPADADMESEEVPF